MPEIQPYLERIAEDGFCVLEEVIPAGAVGEVCASLRASVEEHKLDDPRSHVDKVSGSINVDQSFAPYLVEPRLIGVCRALLGEHVRVSYTTCMVTWPGNPRGGWHADWPFNQNNAGHVPAPYPDAVMHLTSIWMLTPFTAETGTRVVPGSHRRDDNPTGGVDIDADLPHPEEIAVEGEAGSVLVMDSRLWHAISPNETGEPRVAMPIRFAPWWLNLDSLRPGSDERDRLTAGGMSENEVPLVPAGVFAGLPEEVKPLFRHWVDGS